MTAIEQIDAIIAIDDECDLSNEFRELLIARNDYEFDANYEFASQMLELNKLLLSLHREELTELLLQFSLCPFHAIDYAICFDDNDPECIMIRSIHPSHDS